MKTNKIQYLFLFLLMVGITGCDINEIDEVASDPSVKFSSPSTSLTIDSNLVEYVVEVEQSNVYTADKVYNIVATDASTFSQSDFTFVGSIVVKTGDLKGSAPIKFNFDAMPSDVPRKLILNIEGTDKEIEIEYTKICQSNDVNLSLTFDRFPRETSWDIKDANGTVVESGNGYTTASQTLSLDFTLADGNYTFTIYDSFSDGICCRYGQGSYTLSQPACSKVFGSGGEFGASESITFSVP